MVSASTSSGRGGPGLEPGKPPPRLALRTYMYLRLGMFGVIAALAVSLLIEARSSGWCWQPSISAYYYTPVNAVFIGALVTLGTCMVVIWGRSWVEDGLLNLAGLLAPVVAFVPTADTDSCGIAESQRVVVAARPYIDNNVAAYGIVVGLALLALGVAVVLWPAIRDAVRQGRAWYAFWVPYAAACAIWVLFAYLFLTRTETRSDWFYRHGHDASAIPLFLLIVGVVVVNAYEAKRRNDAEWAKRYSLLATLMVLSVVVVAATLWAMSRMGENWEHWILVIEAAVLTLFATFWLLQTVERRGEGAPLLLDEQFGPR
jgi:hypothetical protein